MRDPYEVPANHIVCPECRGAPGLRLWGCRRCSNAGWIDTDAPAPTPAASAGELRERVAEAIMESCINDPRHMLEGRWYPMLYKYEAMAALAEIAKTHDIVERETT